MFKAPSKNVTYKFLGKIKLCISYELSAKQTIHMKYEALFSQQNNNNSKTT